MTFFSSLLNAGVNTSTAPALSVREARLALGEAEDDLVTARQVLEACDRRLVPSQEPIDPNDPAVLDRWGNPNPILLRDLERSRADAAEYQAAHPLESQEAAVAKAARAVAAEHAGTLAIKAVRAAREAFLEAARKGAVAVEILGHVDDLAGALGAELYALTSTSSCVVPLPLVRRNTVGRLVNSSQRQEIGNDDPQRNAALFEPALAWREALAQQPIMTCEEAASKGRASLRRYEGALHTLDEGIADLARLACENVPHRSLSGPEVHALAEFFCNKAVEKIIEKIGGAQLHLLQDHASFAIKKLEKSMSLLVKLDDADAEGTA